jgi:hypothetical protein
VRINNLFFVDDNLLLCRATLREWLRLQNVLTRYENASGQRLNKDKTSIFFSRNTKASVKGQILLNLGVQATITFEKYLGLPTMVGRYRSLPFTSVKDHI